MDYELEMGYFVSTPVPYGERMDIEDAKQHIFGFVLLVRTANRKKPLIFESALTDVLDGIRTIGLREIIKCSK